MRTGVFLPLLLALLLRDQLAAEDAPGVVERILEGAERQVGVTVVYDGSYRRLAYPGDAVTWRLASGLPHIGIVSPRSSGGRPLVVHNVGAGTVFEDALFANPVTGHYRCPPAPPGSPISPAGGPGPSSSPP